MRLPFPRVIILWVCWGQDSTSPVTPTCALNTITVFDEGGKPVAEMPTPGFVNENDHPAFCWVTMAEAGDSALFHWEFQ